MPRSLRVLPAPGNDPDTVRGLYLANLFGELPELGHGRDHALCGSRGSSRPQAGANAVSARRKLFEAGGHFVLLGSSGVPLWRGWPDRRPPLDVVCEHEDPLGIIPSSIHKLVCDVDRGEPAGVWKVVGTPVVALPTPRGEHGYYERLKRPLNRARFDLGFAAGDLIQGPRSYVQLYKDGAERLVEALVSGRVVTLQRELFGLDEIARAEVIGDLQARRPRKSPVLEDVLPGARNDSLFDAVRFWAYAQGDMGRDLAAWKLRCALRAIEENERFPVSLPEEEARYLGAQSIATWTWSRYTGSGFKPYDHSSEAQRRRIIKRHHGNAGPWTLQHVRERNEYIRLQCAAAASRAARGAVVQELVGRFGLSQRQVQRIAAGAGEKGAKRHT